MLAKLRPFIGIGLIVLLLLFILFNLDPVIIRFFVVKVEMPAAFVILFSAALGAGAVYALRFMKVFKKKEKV